MDRMKWSLESKSKKFGRVSLVLFSALTLATVTALTTPGKRKLTKSFIASPVERTESSLRPVYFSHPTAAFWEQLTEAAAVPIPARYSK